jgi:uncharacterized protein YlzI (FlbEa/FlbD family)
MMTINGIFCETIEQLEEQILNLSEEQKQLVRNDFNGVVNSVVTNTVPKIVTPRQIRIALIASGISLDTIENAIAALPEPNKSIAKVTWEYSVEFQRNNPLIASMGPVLGLTESQIDQLFIFAATL